jgi:hypothetical protein
MYSLVHHIFEYAILPNFFVAQIGTPASSAILGTLAKKGVDPDQILSVIFYFMHRQRILRTLPNNALFQNVEVLPHY